MHMPIHSIRYTDREPCPIFSLIFLVRKVPMRQNYAHRCFAGHRQRITTSEKFGHPADWIASNDFLSNTEIRPTESHGELKGPRYSFAIDNAVDIAIANKVTIMKILCKRFQDH